MMMALCTHRTARCREEPAGRGDGGALRPRPLALRVDRHADRRPRHAFLPRHDPCVPRPRAFKPVAQPDSEQP
eukprot:3933446-Rhodomonas_salina.2